MTARGSRLPGSTFRSVVTPAKAGIQDFERHWIPAPGLKHAGTSFAGMTVGGHWEILR
jgi:hypothetical protein